MHGQKGLCLDGATGEQKLYLFNDPVTGRALAALRFTSAAP